MSANKFPSLTLWKITLRAADCIGSLKTSFVIGQKPFSFGFLCSGFLSTMQQMVYCICIGMRGSCSLGTSMAYEGRVCAYVCENRLHWLFERLFAYSLYLIVRMSIVSLPIRCSLKERYTNITNSTENRNEMKRSLLSESKWVWFFQLISRTDHSI